MSGSGNIVRLFVTVCDFFNFKRKLAVYNSAALVIFILLTFFSCKKIDLVPIGLITGPSAVCYASAEEIYSIDPGPDVKVIWTVPEDAEIISGQSTAQIKVKFGRKEGRVSAQYYKDGEAVSDSASFLNVTFGIPGKWCRIPDFGGSAIQSAATFTIGPRAYVVSGFNGTVRLDDVWGFDSDNNTWQKKQGFVGDKRDQAVAFSIGNKGYIGTGYISTAVLSDFWEYNPDTDAWAQKANCGTEGRQYAFGFSLNNKGYIGGGKGDVGNDLVDFYEYNPLNNEWTQKTSLLQPCYSPAAFAIGNKAYMGTGINSQGYRTEFWEFDPNDMSNGLDANNNPLGKWVQKADFPGAGRQYAVAFSINSKGYIGTGMAGQNFKKDFWEYNPEQNSWVEKDSIPVGRYSAVGFSINGKGYVGTGVTGIYLSNDFYVYTP